MDLRGRAFSSVYRLRVLLMLFHTTAGIMAEQEVENLSGLSTNPEKDIFVVRENGTTCLMAEFAAKFIVPYDVWASNYVDLITEQADISLTRGAEVKGRCGHNESELQVFWVDRAYALKMLFVKESHNASKGPEATWRLSKVQFVYDSLEKTHFKDAVSAGKHTANSHHLSALVTPAGKSYQCQAQQTISLASSDPQKTVTMILSAVHIQPFDIISDFVFSEEHKCPVDEREQLEETLPLILGLILGLVIVVTLAIYHIHHKMTANQRRERNVEDGLSFLQDESKERAGKLEDGGWFFQCSVPVRKKPWFLITVGHCTRKRRYLLSSAILSLRAPNLTLPFPF
uniref:Lysosome-associated membrane glycoprotein 5 n=1 Tax=Felis catus TaxID=9685 RepID=A0ABI7XG72_FELCA